MAGRGQITLATQSEPSRCAPDLRCRQLPNRAHPWCDLALVCGRADMPVLRVLLGERVAAPKLRPRCLWLRCRSASRVRLGEYVGYGAGYGAGAIDGYECGGIGDLVELG